MRSFDRGSWAFIRIRPPQPIRLHRAPLPHGEKVFPRDRMIALASAAMANPQSPWRQ